MTGSNLICGENAGLYNNLLRYIAWRLALHSCVYRSAHAPLIQLKQGGTVTRDVNMRQIRAIIVYNDTAFPLSR